MVTEITMKEIQDGLLISENHLHILMFFGSTCGPCKATMPNYEAATKFYKEKNAKIQCFKINAWEPAEQAHYCATNWNVQGVPNFKAFYKNEMILEKGGGGDEPMMRKFIHNAIDEVFKRFGERI